jgi:hypothetical protein
MQAFQPTSPRAAPPPEEDEDPLIRLCTEIQVHGNRMVRFSQQPFDANDPHALATLIRMCFSELGNTFLPLLHDFAKQSTGRHIRAEDWMDDAAPLLPDVEKSGLTKDDHDEFISYLEAIDRLLDRVLEATSDAGARDEILVMKKATADRIERVHDIELPDDDEPDEPDEPAPPGGTRPE